MKKIIKRIISTIFFMIGLLSILSFFNLTIKNNFIIPIAYTYKHNLSFNTNKKELLKKYHIEILVPTHKWFYTIKEKNLSLELSFSGKEISHKKLKMEKVKIYVYKNKADYIKKSINLCSKSNTKEERRKNKNYTITYCEYNKNTNFAIYKNSKKKLLISYVPYEDNLNEFLDFIDNIKIGI